MKKRILSALLATAIAVMALPTLSLPVNAVTTYPAIMLSKDGKVSGIATGDHIYFGKYGGNDISWRVLSTTGNATGTTTDSLSDGTKVVANDKAMFLLSENALESIPFDEETPWSNTYQGNYAQAWCKDFATVYSTENTKGAFTTTELSAILKTTKSDSETSVNGINYGTSSLSTGTDIDKVFFLSAEEASNTAYFNDDNDRKASDGTSAVGWWLRSPNAYATYDAGLVFLNGRVNYDCVLNNGAARPAFNLNQTSVLFSSAASGGKSSGTVGAGALQEVTASATPITEWKLTLKDSARTFSVTETAMTAVAGTTKTISYSNAKTYDRLTAPNEYISAIITSGTGENEQIEYYGRLVQPENASGEVNITIPSDLAAGTYTLKVFNEQYNSDKQTDYSSAFDEIQLTVVEPTATVGDKTVSGTQGKAITATDVTLTLTNETFNTIAADTDVSTWFTNLPTGLVAKVKADVTSGATTATITISGTPTAVSSATMEITIPATALTGGVIIIARENANAKWDIEQPIISIGTQPTDKNVTVGSITGNLTVSATVSNDNEPSYQWYSCTSTAKAGEATIATATTNEFTIPTDLVVGTYYYFCKVSATGATDVDTDVATVTVSAAPVAPTITTDILPNGTVGTAYSQTLVATGDTPITWAVSNGNLPDGLSLDTSTGVISGTPTAAGATSFTVKATNACGEDTQVLSITINAASVTPPTGGGSTGGSTRKTYHFTKGTNGEWESNSDSGLEFTADGEFSNFLRVEVDGKIIDKSNYTAKSGSTIITLKPEYLATLSAGTHKLTVVYKDGSVTTNFKVVQIEDIAAGAGIEGEEDTIPDDENLPDDEPLTDADVKSEEEKPAETTSSDENPATGNSLSGVFAITLLAITIAGVTVKKRRK